jgi:TonB family protein
MRAHRSSNVPFGLWGAAAGVALASTLPPQTPTPTRTPIPKLTGGFGRPRVTAVPAEGAKKGKALAITPGPAGPGSADARLVDTGSGPISFDTKWYDWGAYAAEMVRRIKLHWDVPELARLGLKGSLTVRFYILADGRVEAAQIIHHSGIPPFDSTALQAILNSSPFRPLPEALREDREGVTVTFFYNMRPDGKPGLAQ